MHDAHGFQSMDEAGIDQANASQDYKKCQKLAPVHISQHASTWSNRMCQPLAQWWLTARLACVAERHSSVHINCMHACAEAARTARHAAKTAIQHKLHIIASRVRSKTLFFKACSPRPCAFSKTSAAARHARAPLVWLVGAGMFLETTRLNPARYVRTLTANLNQAMRAITRQQHQHMACQHMAITATAK